MRGVVQYFSDVSTPGSAPDSPDAWGCRIEYVGAFCGLGFGVGEMRTSRTDAPCGTGDNAASSPSSVTNGGMDSAIHVNCRATGAAPLGVSTLGRQSATSILSGDGHTGNGGAVVGQAQQTLC